MLNIATNGYVYFGQKEPNVFNSVSNSVYAQNADLDTSMSGGIYYQNLNSQSNEFNSIKSDINRLNSAFNPTDLFRITFDKVPVFRSSLFTSFQIILASSSSSSFVVLKYTTCLATLIRTPALYYTLSNGRSTKNEFFNSCESSNVNLTGTWVFDVSSQIGMSFILSF